MGLTPVFAETQTFSHLWSRPNHIPARLEGYLPDNTYFKQVLTRLRKLKCSVKLLEVNNPGHRFGLGHSIFPYICPPSNLTHLPDGRYRPLSIACIKWGGGYFYLFNFLDNKELVLFYHKALTALSHKDCNDLLLQGIDVYFNWEAVAEKSPYSGSYIIISFDSKTDIDWISDSIHGSIKHAIAYYNLMDNYSKQINEIKLSHTPSYDEWMKVSNNIHAIYYTGNYIGEPFMWEKDKKFAVNINKI